MTTTQTPKDIAIIGLGWLGLPLAKELHGIGHRVHGSVSSLEKLKLLHDLPIPVKRLSLSEDGIEGDLNAFLSQADLLIITIPPGRREGVQTSYPAMMDQIIHIASPHLKVIFTSTTGVYADENTMVNEMIRPNPAKASGQAVVKAEEKLTDHFGANLTVLRLAGLIGKDRHPGRFLAGKKGLKNGDAPVNLVHQKDCIGVIERVIASEAWGTIINVCASQHPTRKAYYQMACAALNLDPPQFEDSEPVGFKIVDNTYIKKLLN